MVKKDVLSGKQSAPFRSFKSSRKPGVFRSMLATFLATVWWCVVAVFAHLMLRSKLWASLESDFNSNPLKIFKVYRDLFKCIGESGYGFVFSTLLSLLAAVALLIVSLRNMFWPMRELPGGVQMHRAWLQEVLDNSACEDVAMFLMLQLCGMYGVIVVCWGFVVAAKNWKGVSMMYFFILLVLYLFVSVWPALFLKSDAGKISGYARTLIRVANLAEWRCRNGSEGVLSGEYHFLYGASSIFLSKQIKGLRCFVGRYGGVVVAVMVLFAALIQRCLASEVKYKAVLVVVGVYACLLLVALGVEFAVLVAVNVKASFVSVGRINFDAVIMCMQGFAASIMAWIAFFVVVSRSTILVTIGLLLLFWWIIRIYLSLTIKPRENKISKIRGCLENVSGLRDAMSAEVDQRLLLSKESTFSYRNDAAQVSDELAVVADLVIPQGYVVEGSIRGNVFLRFYLFSNIGLMLPVISFQKFLDGIVARQVCLVNKQP